MKKKKIFNWHFWIPSYKIQVVVSSTCYCKAVSHLKHTLSYYNRPCPKLEFQFGQLD